MVRFIAVAGGIGAGKSSFIDFLREHHGLVPFYERNDENPFLEDFYRQGKAFAFAAQVWFLARKFQSHREIVDLDRPAILDRTIYEDAEIFALNLHRMGLMSPREWQTYQSLYRTICSSLPPPDLVVYLKAGARTQRRRILLRGRPMERDVETSYLQRINRLYGRWISAWDRSPVLTIDADRLDFVADLVHRADVLRELKRYLPPRRGGEHPPGGSGTG